MRIVQSHQGIFLATNSKTLNKNRGLYEYSKKLTWNDSTFLATVAWYGPIKVRYSRTVHYSLIAVKYFKFLHLEHINKTIVFGKNQNIN